MKYLILLCCILLAGCVTTRHPQYNFHTLKNYEVLQFMLETNQLWSVSHYEISSVAPYAVPSSTWVKDIFTPRLDKYLFDNNNRQYVLGENDCVKFSTHAISEAYTAYHNEIWRESQTTLAVGVFDYCPTALNNVGHEIIFFIINDDDGKGYQLKFYEPQRRAFIDLNFFERLSAYRWRM